MDYTEGEWTIKQLPITKEVYIVCGTELIAGGLTEANAHLISASPDLYEALLSALGIMATLDQNKGWVKEISSKIQQALTKAEGGK